MKYIDKEDMINKIVPGCFVMAKTPNYRIVNENDDLSHLYRPFFVVGKDKNFVYGLYSTSQKKYENDKHYFNFYNNGDNENEKDIGYVYIARIESISYDCIDRIKYYCSKLVLDRIINNLSEYVVDSKRIDYDYIDITKSPNSIVLYNNEFYVYKKKVKNKSPEIILNKLIKTDDKNDSIMINGNYYTVDFTNNIRVLKRDVVTVKNNAKLLIDKIKYNFGDIVLVNNKKMIYITKGAYDTYCCLLDSLEIYSGLEKINFDNISQKLGELKVEEKEKLAKKINKSLDSGNERINSEALIGNIKESIKRR